MIPRLVAFCAALLLFTSGPMAVAQFGNSGFGNSGFGNSGFGSGMGSSGFGSSGFGSSGFGSGSSGFGGAGFGASRFGSGGLGSSGLGGNRFGSGMGGNSAFGNTGLGGQYGGGQNFVGRDAGDMQQVFGQMGRASQEFMRQMNRNSGRNNNNRRQTTQKIQNPPQPMRVEVRVGFNAPGPAPAQLANTIRTRVTRILADHKMSTPVLNMDGDTAVISGVAASENERDVIAQLIALEPGVRDVRNEMTVAPPASADIARPPGS